MLERERPRRSWPFLDRTYDDRVALRAPTVLFRLRRSRRFRGRNRVSGREGTTQAANSEVAFPVKADRLWGLAFYHQSHLRRQDPRRARAEEELAFRAGMDRSHLSDLERNEKSPTVTVLFRLCDAMGVIRLDHHRASREGTPEPAARKKAVVVSTPD